MRRVWERVKEPSTSVVLLCACVYVFLEIAMHAAD